MRKASICGIAVFAVAAVLAATGCSSLGIGSTQQQEMVVSDSLVVSDLPVPRGFKIVNDRSFFNVDPTTGTRVIWVRYRGRGDALRLMEFFRQNMAVSGWTLKKESGDFGKYVQEFDKDKESAEVRIVPGTFVTDFVISLKPGSSR